MRPYLLTFREVAGEQVLTLTATSPQGDLARELPLPGWSALRAPLLARVEETDLPRRGFVAVYPDDPFDEADLHEAAARLRNLALLDAARVLLPVLRCVEQGSLLLYPGPVGGLGPRRLNLRESSFAAIEAGRLTAREARRLTTACYWTAEGAMAQLAELEAGAVPVPRGLRVVLARSRHLDPTGVFEAALRALRCAPRRVPATVSVTEDLTASCLPPEHALVLIAHQDSRGIAFGDRWHSPADVADQLAGVRMAILHLCHGDTPTSLAVHMQARGVPWVSANRGKTLLGAALHAAARLVARSDGFTSLPELLDHISLERLAAGGYPTGT
jgi:hypothetical protein